VPDHHHSRLFCFVNHIIADLFDVPNDTGKCSLAWFLHGESVRSLEPDGAFMESGRVFDKLTYDTWRNPCQKGYSR
jgi:hypothetical protein